MSPSLNHFVGFGVALKEGVDGSLIRAEDKMRDDECYNYAHYHPDWDRDWSDEQKEQFEQEHADEIERAKARFQTKWDNYAMFIEVEKVGVMDFTRDVVLYEPSMFSGYRGTTSLDMKDLDVSGEAKEDAANQIQTYLDFLGIEDHQVRKGPTWLAGASYW